VAKKRTESGAASSPTWETLEAFARQSMQQFLRGRWKRKSTSRSRALGMNGVSRSMRRSAIATGLGNRDGSA
jgi:hypothetical protein